MAFIAEHRGEDGAKEMLGVVRVWNDPDNIRNRKEWGGGGLMDIGCYAISLSRFLFGREPRRVVDTFEALFRREIQPSELIMATSESIAHLNRLIAEGRMAVERDADGVDWYRGY